MKRSYNTLTKRKHDGLRDVGEADFKAGKSIDAFYEVPKIKHTELERGSYEVGWRFAKAEAMEHKHKEEREHVRRLLGI